MIYWPERSEINQYYPKCFQPFKNVRADLDCTKVRLEKPSLAQAQSQTYSKYKNTNTAKFLFACTPAGTPCFVSKGFGDKASDQLIAIQSGVIDNFESGDSCTVDKALTYRICC